MQSQKKVLGCTTLGEEMCDAFVAYVRGATDAKRERNLIARFPPLRYTLKLLPYYEFSYRKRFLCRSARSNPPAAAAPKFTAFSYAWLPKPEPLY